MTIEKITQDILYSSVELKILGQTQPSIEVEAESKPALETVPTKEVVCPKCGSQGCWKRGYRDKGRKEYSCKTCKKFFIIYPLLDKEGREFKCRKCQSKNYIFAGETKDGRQNYRGTKCGHKYILDLLREGKIFTCTRCDGNNCYRNGTAKTGKPVARCLDCAKYFTVGGDYIDPLIAPDKFNFNHDVWTAKHLGYENGIHKHYKLNFEYIEQP